MSDQAVEIHNALSIIEEIKDRTLAIEHEAGIVLGLIEDLTQGTDRFARDTQTAHNLVTEALGK